MEGKLIVIDGVEGSGKSTQAKLLTDYLNSTGYNAIQVDEPGTTEISKEIRQVLLHKKNIKMSMRAELMLFMAARAQLVEEVIRPALQRGQTVVADRYVSSTLAYQAGEDGITNEDVLMAFVTSTKACWADFTLIIDLPIEQMRFRKLGVSELDRIESRPAEYFEKVRERYNNLIHVLPGKVTVINGQGTIERVQERILHFIKIGSKS